jgi:hypothetical protein
VAYQVGFYGQLHGAFPGGVGLLQRHELTHFLDLRAHLYLDCNEKLLVADDAALHLALSRGAIEPLSSLPKKPRGEFLRISPFHGFYLSGLSSGFKTVWENPECLDAWEFFRSMEAGAGSRRSAASPFAGWLWDFAVSDLKRKYLPTPRAR